MTSKPDLDQEAREQGAHDVGVATRLLLRTMGQIEAATGHDGIQGMMLMVSAAIKLPGVIAPATAREMLHAMVDLSYVDRQDPVALGRAQAAFDEAGRAFRQETSPEAILKALIELIRKMERPDAG